MKNKKKKFLIIIPVVIILAVVGGMFWKAKQKQEIEVEISELEEFIKKNGYECGLPKLTVDISDWQTYHSDDFGFSFKHPRDWEVSFWGTTRNKPGFFKPDFWNNSDIEGQVYQDSTGCIKPRNFEKNKDCVIYFDKIVSKWRSEKNAWLLWLQYDKNEPCVMIDGQFVLDSGGDYMFRVQDNNMIRINHPQVVGSEILSNVAIEEYHNIYNGIINTLHFDENFDPTKE